MSTKIAYFPPESNEWEQMMEYAINQEYKVTLENIQAAITIGDARVYSVPEFIKAFNDEHISDQGVILQIIEY